MYSNHLPAFCFHVLESNEDEVIMIKRGENGYNDQLKEIFEKYTGLYLSL